MTIGGKTAHHMADLILGEETEAQETRIDKWHDAVNEYIENHKQSIINRVQKNNEDEIKIHPHYFMIFKNTFGNL